MCWSLTVVICAVSTNATCGHGLITAPLRDTKLPTSSARCKKTVIGCSSKICSEMNILNYSCWIFWDQYSTFLAFNCDLSSFGCCVFSTCHEWNLKVRSVCLPAAEVCALQRHKKHRYPFFCLKGFFADGSVFIIFTPVLPPPLLGFTIQAISNISIFSAVLLDIFVSLKSKRCQMEAPCSSSMIISSILLWGCITYVHEQLKILLSCMNCVCSRTRKRFRNQLRWDCSVLFKQTNFLKRSY